MSYIGKTTDGFGVRDRFVYVVSAGATSVSGADANGATLKFTDGAYVDVYLNGVLLKPTTDYNTSTANTIAGISSMSASDEVTVIVYDVFTVADTVSATSGGTFSGATTHNGGITSTTLETSSAVSIGSSASNPYSFSGTTNPVGINATGTNQGSQLSIASTGTGVSAINLGNDSIRRGGVFAVDGSHLTFATNNGNSGTSITERMRIDNLGRVGVGTDSPTSIAGWTPLLHLRHLSSPSIILEDTTHNNSQAALGYTGTALYIDSAGHSSSSIQFRTATDPSSMGSSKASIDINGQFMHTADMNSLAGYIINSNATPYGIYLQFTGAAPNNTDNYFLSGLDTSATRIKLFSSGTVKNSTGTYTSFSDERLKSDIVDAKSQWEDIKALNFKNFIKFDNPDFKQLGLIAQDVEKTSPNLVFETPPEPEEIKHSSVFGILYEDGDTIPEGKKIGDVKEVKSKVKNVKDSILYMKSVKALQEAMARIETLEAKVKALEEA